MKEKKSIWSFGTRVVVYAAIGAALYGVLSWVFNFLQLPASGNVAFRPAVVIPLFFGIAFGPIVASSPAFWATSSVICSRATVSGSGGISVTVSSAWLPVYAPA